ncbi:MAG: lamin tail domain-containing protein [candidate division Zixibacteria bacterium]|nr:lamin tail domain-containing protein [candidate division Zixibacteria bacterium]
MSARLLLIVNALFLLLMPCLAGARVVVNEVLSNEPAGYTGLEWFELYNDRDAYVALDFYQVAVGASQFTLNLVMPPHGFLVVCRKLIGTPVNPGFETQWGDNSGVWGDSPTENYPVIEAAFSLPNAAGSVVVSLVGTTESSLSWTASGNDGVSWERERPNSDVIKPCASPSGSTPGQTNSRTPLGLDLSLDTVIVTAARGSAQITMVVGSLSLNTVTGGEITIFYVDPADTTRTDSQIVVISLPTIDTGVTTVVSHQLLLSGAYNRVGATLNHDDRDYNNRKNFVAPGSGFPPIELFEVMANPQDGLSSEWIEVRNREDTAVSLAGWCVGDSVQLSLITALTSAIPSHEYLVLAQDTANVRAFYPGFGGLLIEVSPWPTLNNSGDLVRLVDSFDLLADTFAFTSVFDSNQTWGRPENENRWGRSVDNGGTPGAINNVRFAPAARALKVRVTPQIISPDGDGIDDSALIQVEAPPADGFTVRIYDVQGRLVRTFEHSAVDLAPQYVWQGRDDGGGKLPPGIYILFVEVEGVESIKKTIVVAR